MNANVHITADDAALYALGALEDRERRSVDAHAAKCDECARLLGEAEAEVAMLAQAQPQYELPGKVVELRPERPRRPAWQGWLAGAVAAALLLGTIPATFLFEQNQAMHQAMLADAAAMNQLASEPHRTVAFAGMGNGADAHVMYAMDGSWYVILVRGASKAMQVAWMHDGERTMLGTAQPSGDVALLYLPKSHRMDQLALMDGDQVVAEAKLAY